MVRTPAQPNQIGDDFLFPFVPSALKELNDERKPEVLPVEEFITSGVLLCLQTIVQEMRHHGDKC